RIVVALLIAQLVPVRLQQRLLQGGRAERRAADAEHDDRVERLTDALRKGPDLLRDGALVRKREEAQLSALAAPDGVRMDCAETVRHAVEHVRLKAAAAQPRREHVR